MDEKEIDRISNLPDEILLRIISFLPSESAIQSIFLSKRWRLLWNQALVLHGTRDEVAGAVSGFLANFDEHDPTKNTRKLYFHFDEGNTLLAIIAPYSALRLSFSSGESIQETSTNLSWHLELNSNDNQNITRQPIHSTFFVRSLNLVSVTHLTRDAVSSIFSNFRFVEKLKIIRCLGLTSLCVESMVKLVHLTVFDCPQLQFLEIKSFKLKSLRYRGFFPLFRIKYHFNLTDAMFDTRQGPGCNVLRSLQFDPVLLTIKNSETLTICKWIFQAFICPTLSMFRADFQLYKLKELWWIDSSLNGENITYLISFLKLCPSLERLFITIDPGSFSMETTVTYSKMVGERTRLEKLDLVRLEGCKSQEIETLLCDDSLQEIVKSQPLIVTYSDSVWRPVKASQSHASKWRPFEAEDVKGLRQKHPHMGL